MDAHGEFVPLEEAGKYLPSKCSKKPILPSGRRPLGQRDPNTNGASSNQDPLRKGKSERDIINVQGLVRNTMANGNNGNSRQSALLTTTSSPFQIYDETKVQRTTQSASSTNTVARSSAGLSSPVDLVAQTNALSVKDNGRNLIDGAKPEFGRAQSVVSAVSSNVGSGDTVANTENDANILHQMLANLETVMEVTKSRKGTYHSTSARPVSRGGPNKWVTRYVDYTSKYGLGFLLNDGR